MTKTGRAVVYVEPNAPFEVREYPVRDARPGEVLVRVTMSTICRSDIHSYEGHRPNPCPGILGHEIIGVIEQLGDGVRADMRGDPLAAGDRITWTEYFADGSSYQRDVLDMPQKAPGLRKYGHDLADDDPHFLGGFADYCYVLPGTGILKLPKSISDEEATPLNCGVATMISVTEAAAIEMGETVVVQGLGLLGIYGCAIARSRGAARVIGIDAVPARLDTAKRFGADITLDPTAMDEDELVRRVREASPPDGPDVVLEVCGVAAVVPSGIRMLRTGGRYVLAGLINPESNFTLDGNDLIRKLITLKGIHNYHPRHLVQALDFVMANRDRFPFKEIVDSRFGLHELGEAFARAASRDVLRAAIVPGGTDR
jgi:putative phosphonate catabolism associated alcohol dehydrogenase